MSVQDIFLLAVARTGNETVSAHLCGVSHKQITCWKTAPAFKAQLEHAHQAAADWLKYSAWQRAVTGIQVPYFFQGEIVGHKRIYSDKLLLWLLNQYFLKHDHEDEVTGEDAHIHASLEQKLAQLARAFEPPAAK